MLYSSKLIGIHGPKGSGKTFLARLINEEILLNSYRYAFADPIKAGLSAMLGIPLERLNSSDKSWIDPVSEKELRFLCTTLGTEWGRNIVSPELWTRRAKAEIQHAQANHKDLIIHDVRYDNEAELIHRKGGYVVKILSDRKSVDQSQNDHTSELPISDDLVDFVVVNNESTTVEELQEQITSFIKTL